MPSETKTRKAQAHVAVVGMGYWGKNLARNIHTLGALHTVCDRYETVLKCFRDQYQGVRTCLKRKA